MIRFIYFFLTNRFDKMGYLKEDPTNFFLGNKSNLQLD